MHELSLAQGLLSQLHDLAAQNKANRIITVKVEIGPLSGIVVDSFQFGFSALAAESPLTRAAALEISVPEAVYKCLACGYLLKSNESAAVCPACHGKALLPEGGGDIILLQVEMDTEGLDNTN